MNVIGQLVDNLWSVFLALPVATQFAITLLLVCGVIAHAAYGERVVHDGPSILTTGGIFFTFLGIAQGLYGFDPTKVDASLPVLLSGLKTAFFASVVGVLAALTIKLRYALFGLPIRVHDERTEDATVDDLYRQLVAVRQSIAGTDDSTLLTQLKLTRTDSNDRMDRLQRSYDEFARKVAENNSKALIQALQEVIRDFNTKISEQFGENFKQLNEAVGRLLNWQENYRTQISEMIGQQSEAAANMKSASDRYTELVSKAEVFGTVSAKLSQILSGLEIQRTQLEGSLESLGKLLTQASGSLPQIESKIVQLTEQVTLGVKQNQDQMTKAVQGAAVSFQEAIADARKVLLENMQATNQQVNDHMKQLADKTTEQLVKLDAALETELAKSISSLGRQLTALSSRFVEDYTPLTDRLRSLLNGLQRA